jgi:hypothetical protein
MEEILPYNPNNKIRLLPRLRSLIGMMQQLEEIGHCQKIHQSIFPKRLKAFLPGVTTDGAENIYTTFTGQREGDQCIYD